MKEAPFRFGGIVTGKHFTNREDEILRLQNNFKSLQNSIIISPRRYGKSSLVTETAKRFLETEKGFIICFLDLMYVYSEEEFYNRFATTIIKATSNKIEEFIQSAKNVIRGSKITINSGTGEPGIELGVNYIKDNLDTILNLPEVIAKKKNKKIVICIDEFQNISRFENHERLQGRIRSAWQQHKKVCYTLYGSKKTMMVEIFNKTNSPFYKFGDTIYLNRIKTDRLKRYVTNAFNSSGKEIPDDICEKLINTVENHPYYLQQFARNLWLISGKKVNENDFEEAMKAILADNLNFYNEIFDALTTYQVSFLKAILTGEEHLYSSEVINKYKLGSSANIKRMFNSLISKGIILNEDNKIKLTDPIFKYIARDRFLDLNT